MDNKKNNFVGDIYNSFGPFVGKVCENTNTQLYKDNIIESITSSVNNSSSPLHNSNENEQINFDIKTGGESNYLEQNNVLNEEESTSFFSYKISIFNCKISIWVIILILLVVICIGYFIYKYWFMKDSSTLITYKKNVVNSSNEQLENDNSESITDNSSSSESYSTNDLSLSKKSLSFDN